MTAPLTSRGALGWLGAVLGASLSAAAYAFALAHAETVLLFFAYLAPLPLFVVGLGSGAVSGVLASLIATAGLYVLVDPATAGTYAVINALPVALLSLLALRYRTSVDGKIYWLPEGRLLTALFFYPCLVFLIIFGATMDYEGGLLGKTTEALQGMGTQISASLQTEQAANISAVMDQLARILPALAGCSWAFLILFSALAAQYALRQQKWNLRAPFSYGDLQVPNWLVGAVALTGLAGYFAPTPYDYAGLNLCAMLCLPYFFVGLVLVHAFTARRKMRLAMLILFYALLSFLPQLALFVVLLGALDQGMDFRRRFAAPPKVD